MSRKEKTEAEILIRSKSIFLDVRMEPTERTLGRTRKKSLLFELFGWRGLLHDFPDKTAQRALHVHLEGIHGGGAVKVVG